MVEEVPWLYQLCLMATWCLMCQESQLTCPLCILPVTMLSVYMLLYSQRLEIPSTKIPLFTDTSITLVMKR